MARSDTMIHVRLAPELKEFICLRAKDQERSINAHVVFLIRQEMEKEKASGNSLQATIQIADSGNLNAEE